MTLSVDLFFSFRSPYSYLALTRTRKMVADYDVTVNLRPVYPLAVRVPGFFKKTNPQFAKYVVLDSMRVAKHDNIPFRFPRPDPIVQDMTTLDVAAHQPHIHRLTRLGAAAQLEGSKAFAKDVMAAAGVPTAAARVCTSAAEVAAALDEFGPPLTLVGAVPVAGALDLVHTSSLRVADGAGIPVHDFLGGEPGDVPDRYPDAKSRRNYAGTSPVTKASGKFRVVLARYARNKRLADAADQWAFCSLLRSPGARA